jgi:hypothetical protein
VTAVGAAPRIRGAGSGAARPVAPDPLEEEFKGWHVWQSDGGHWRATRTGKRADYYKDGIPMTAGGGTRSELRDELAGYAEAWERGSPCARLGTTRRYAAAAVQPARRPDAPARGGTVPAGQPVIAVALSYR